MQPRDMSTASPAEKRQAIADLLATYTDLDYPGDRAIGRMLNVSHHTVFSVRTGERHAGGHHGYDKSPQMPRAASSASRNPQKQIQPEWDQSQGMPWWQIVGGLLAGIGVVALGIWSGRESGHLNH